MNKIAMLNSNINNISLETAFEDFIKCKKSQSISNDTITYYEASIKYFRFFL